MVQVLEAETAPASIEATLNYIADTGTKIFTQTGGPGSTDVRSGGTQDPRRVVIRNGRLQAQDFALERHGFRLVSHDTRSAISSTRPRSSGSITRRWRRW